MAKIVLTLFLLFEFSFAFLITKNDYYEEAQVLGSWISIPPF